MSDLKDPNRDEALDKELTQLVSYLDGELDESQMTQMEVQLASDQGLRSHADILSRTWSMLDSLDEVPVSDTFTQDTMATIQAEASDGDTPTPRRSSSRRILTLLSEYKVLPAFLLGLLAGLAGLGLSTRGGRGGRGGPGPNGPPEDIILNEIVINNLDVLQNAGRYQEIPSAEQLRKVELKDVVDPVAPAVEDSP